MTEYAALPHTTGRWPTAVGDIVALPAPYVLPAGVLLIALADERSDPPPETALGCGALISREPAVAEIKRVYVRPHARRRGIGEAITRELISWAGTLGFERVRLDTAPELLAARALYAQLGFYPIPHYRAGLLPDALCFERAVHHLTVP
ncbi:MAG: GNAT family N-acetyltransferase [Gemmatimonadaceae bacterium]